MSERNRAQMDGSSTEDMEQQNPGDSGTEELREDLRIVTFSLGRKAYGIDIMQVKEISSARRFTYVPNTAGYVRGVFNLRGEIIPVLDMRLFFNLDISGERSELDITRNNEIYEDLIILSFGYINIGIIVDNISHVVSIERSMIQHSHPLFAELDLPYIDGIINYKKQLYIILAIHRIIDPQLDTGETQGFEEVFMPRLVQSHAEQRSAPESGQLLPVRESQQPGVCPGGQEAGDAPSLPPSSADSAVQDARDFAQGRGDTGENPDEADPAPQSVATETQDGASEPRGEAMDTPEVRDPNERRLFRALAREGFMSGTCNAELVEQQWRNWYRAKNIDVPEEELLDSPHNCREFIESLRSKSHNQYWSEDLQLVVKRYFENHSGNLNVWHAGCGSGRETYSLTAALISAAPEAHIQVRAADADLLEVAEAPLLKVGAPSELPAWLREYLNQERGKEGYSFAKALKDRIIFEYQDVLHASPHTRADLIVIRDLLSRYPAAEQDYILETLTCSIKMGGLIVVGDNESLSAEEWELVEHEPLRIYRRKSARKAGEGSA